MRWGPFLFVAAILLLSGCTQSSAPKAPSAQPTGVVKADAFANADQSESGEIVGRILDDEFRPLPEVIVKIQGTSAQAQTTQDGVFYFTKVPPRTYTLQYAKPGFEVKNQTVSVVALQRSVVEAMLARVADTTPYADEGFLFRGHFNCSVRVNATGQNTNPECGEPESDKDILRFQYLALLPDVRQVLLEVQWTASVPGPNDRLTLAIRPYEGQSWKQVQGTSPIRYMITPSDWANIKATTEKDYQRFGGQIQLYMFPGESVQQNGAGAGAAVQQDFAVYATAWYRMDPPEGYTRLPP